MNNDIEIFRIQLIAIFGSIVLIIYVFNLIRKDKLRESFGLLWLISSVVILLLSIFRNVLDKIAFYIGIAYAPAALFLAALAFIGIMLLYFSIVTSEHSEKIKKLSQEVALLNKKTEVRKNK